MQQIQHKPQSLTYLRRVCVCVHACVLVEGGHFRNRCGRASRGAASCEVRPEPSGLRVSEEEGTDRSGRKWQRLSCLCKYSKCQLRASSHCLPRAAPPFPIASSATSPTLRASWTCATRHRACLVPRGHRAVHSAGREAGRPTEPEASATRRTRAGSGRAGPTAGSAPRRAQFLQLCSRDLGPISQ